MAKPIAKHIFIEEHLDIVNRLVRSGDMSGKLLADHKIYKTFLTQPEPLKMDRYESTAIACRCSERTVMNAIKSMESSI